ncbi:hypothetical protein A5482_011185 [Cyanobacterium sp. IPPAS B-1200]|nr:hypothetical protein [Cyanobacterium sp. IPPAS B-1200]
MLRNFAIIVYSVIILKIFAFSDPATNKTENFGTMNGNMIRVPLG